MHNRLARFKESKEAKDKYRNALALLVEVGVDQVLLELSAQTFTDAGHPQGVQMAAAKHYESLGYQKCIADLLSLDKLVEQESAPVSADYGATQRMLDRGEITEEQALELQGEI